MKFEEEFLMLGGCEFTVDNKVTNYKYLGDGERVKLFRDREIALYCLDKQRVKAAIIRVSSNEHPEMSSGWSSKLLKELGLEK